MKNVRGFETFVAVIATFGLAAAAIVATAAPAHGDGVVIVSTDFEDGTLGGWEQSGGGADTLDVVDFEGGKVLQVSNRDADYVGVQTAAGALAGLVPGETYTFTMRARLAEGTAGTAGVRYVMKPAYTWIGNTSMSAGAWTTVSGEYTVAPDADTSALQVYIGTGGEPGTYTYLVDDLVITGPPTEPELDIVTAVDFEDGTTGTWTQSGGGVGTLLVEDDGAGNNVLRVNERDADYVGLQSPTGIFQPSTTYTFSMRARLVPGTEGSAGVRFVMKPAYSWIGNTTMTADAWTVVTGEFTTPADGDPATLQAYIGTGGEPGTYSYLVDDILVTTPDTGGPVDPGDPSALSTDFEDGLDGWVARDNGTGAPTVATVTDPVHAGAQAAGVTDRTSQGSGIGHVATGFLNPGVTYELSAWVRFGEGQPVDDVWLSAQTTSGGTDSFQTLGQFDTVTNTGWTQITQRFTPGSFDAMFLYLETRWSNNETLNTSDFYVDDIVVTVPEPPVIQDLLPIKDTVDFPVGVAIDSRETVGSPSELLLKHFDQVTPENFMKPEAWYNAAGEFTPNAEADALMEFAQEEGLDVYGHVLVWHSQTPAWFFQDEGGAPLSDSATDQAVLEQRLHDHIFSVAEYLSDTYGEFGSDTNPLTAFDVVNEVVSDSGDFADGLRRSEWYRILGERFIDLAFQYAEEAFNEEFAAAGSDRPVTLFINDYNTEQTGKQGRYHALVERLLDRGVPVDGVGHQFHVSLSMPVSALDAALDAFEDTGLVQAVTELDVTTGTPVTQANLIEQGYYYRDAFNVFREHGDHMFSVTVWGLTDGRSWRASAGAPLIFDDGLQAKPAYYGVVDSSELPARLRTANVFRGDVPLDAAAATALAWRQLPLHSIEDRAKFQLRWETDHLTAYVTVTDADVEAGDSLEFDVAGQSGTIGRDGGGTVDGVVTEGTGGYTAVVHLPLATPVAEGGTLQFDVRVVDGTDEVGWNTPGSTGTLTLLEPLSYLEVVETPTAPAIDAAVDTMWSTAGVVTTDKQVSGTGGATATVRTLWKGQTLYVLAEVADPVVDVTGSDPWIQDSVEIYVDAGNFKNGSYRYDDTQIRISAENAVSFGTGDEAFQAARVQSATTLVTGGYRVEAAISLLEYGGLATFHGLDFQVNDASGGARTGIRNWADPSGVGYQSTARWGVGQLVAAPPAPVDPELSVATSTVAAGGKLDVTLEGFAVGSTVRLALQRGDSANSRVTLTTVTIGASGSAELKATVPLTTKPGNYRLVAITDGAVVDSVDVKVTKATVATVVETIITTVIAILKRLFG